MRVCPQCRSAFDNDFVYCSNDGSILVEENLSLPTESDDAEAETVIRRKSEPPIIVELKEPSATQAETVEVSYAAPLPTQTPVIVEKTSNSKFYALFLIVGLLLGGGLVLATLLAAGIINRPTVANVAVQMNENKSRKTENKMAESDTEVDKLADELHQKRTAQTDGDFNGRVIAQNAYVRSSPRSSSNQVDILPVDDRIRIERRENENSPWYFVTCEHGTGGWMHGNTIEFTDGNF